MNLSSIQSQLAYNGTSIRSLHESIRFLKYLISVDKSDTTQENNGRYKQILTKKKQIAKLVKLQKELKADKNLIQFNYKLQYRKELR